MDGAGDGDGDGDGDVFVERCVLSDTGSNGGGSTLEGVVAAAASLSYFSPSDFAVVSV